MIIKELTFEGLDGFINSDEFERMPVIPISRHRAISQINNPRTEPDDILLFIAYEEEKLVGYLGVLPDYYYYNNTRLKVGWLSCFWVDPLKRGRGISMELGRKAVEKWNSCLIATEFTLPSKKLWLKINALDVFMTLQGIRGFLRFELAEILPRKNAVFKKMKGILKLTDYCFNIIINKRLRIKTGNSQEGIFTERINAPDDEWDFFMQPFLPDSLFRRTRPDLAWISGYPWVLPLEKGDKQLDRYYFTAYEKRFEFRFYKLKNAGNEIIACIMISIRNNHLKVPYAFFEDEYVADVMKVLYAIMRKEGIATFTTFNPSITKYLKNNRSHFIFKKGLTREYLASSKVAANLPNGYEIQDGDGDCAFT